MNIDRIKNWATEPLVAVEIAKEIEREYVKQNRFLTLAGTGNDRAIRLKTIKDLSPFRVRMRAALRGKGVFGNTNIDTNLDKRNYFTSEIRPFEVGNGLVSNNLTYEKTQDIDFIKECTEELPEWLGRETYKYILTALSHDLTNVCVADATNGFKKHNKGTSVEKACKECTKGDVLKVSTIRHAIKMAKNGDRFNGEPTFAIPPLAIRSTTKQGIEITQEQYALFISSTQAEQLKADPEWKELQKKNVDGELNPLFTGLIGVIDNCVVVELPEWNLSVDGGIITSDFSESEFRHYVTRTLGSAKEFKSNAMYKGKDTETCIGFLIGAGALQYAASSDTKIVIERKDYDRKVGVAITKLLGVAKSRFENTNYEDDSMNAYNDLDYGVIGIISSKE